LDDVYWQQDGTPAHFDRIVGTYLNDNFPDRWIGRLGPIAWPPRSPDLTPLDFSIWGMLKDIVYGQNLRTIAELKEGIENACAHFDQEMCQKICRSVLHRARECIAANGAQFEHRR